MNVSQREFRLVRCLGRGGFGEVFLAQARSGVGDVWSDVAVKLLHARISPDSDAVVRLRDEARLLAQVNHPAILSYRELLVLDGRIALITEFVDGQDLTACIRDTPPIPLRALLEVVGQVADALEAARTHVGRDGRALGIVHRDVKPSNIRISRHGAVKLLDFGIARGEVDREAATATDTILGSLPYMAPERFQSVNTDPASDVYALGCVLYEGLAGRVLFDQPMPVMVGISHNPERHAGHVARKLDGLAAPEGVLALIRSTLVPDPAARPTAREVAAACERLAATLDAPTLRAWARDRAWPAAVAADPELDGKMLTEGATRDATTALARTELATQAVVAEPEAPAAWWMLGGALGGLVALGAGAVVLVGLIIGVVWWRTSGRAPEPTPSPTPAAAVEGPEAPAVDTEVAAAVEVPVETPTPTPTPAPAAPVRRPTATMTPTPTPTPTPVPMATVVSEAYALRLIGADGPIEVATRVPTKVPAGPQIVWAKFTRGEFKVLEVDLRPGEYVRFQCNDTSEICTAIR